MAEQISFTSIIESASKLPFVHVNREEFLRKNFGKRCTKEQLQMAIDEGTLHAGIPVETLDKLANEVIKAETIKVTAISTAAGIPGGLAMAATIPADLVQFYSFVIRVAQELAYIYGWTEIFTESSEMDAATESQLIIFIGVMSGVEAAKKAVTKLFGEVAIRSVAKRIAAKALTKTWYYPIVKKIATTLGQRMVKATFAKGVSKAVPVVGGVISGGLTLAAFRPMAHKLKKHLSTMARMSPEEFAEYEATVVDVEATIIEEVKYKCDKCGWEADGRARAPKFCSKCGALLDCVTADDTVASNK